MNGPSLTSSTAIMAPNRPVATSIPRPRRAVDDGRRPAARPPAPGAAVAPGRAAALAGVGVERELADHEHRARRRRSRTARPAGSAARRSCGPSAGDLLGPVVVGGARPGPAGRAGRSHRPPPRRRLTLARVTRCRTALTAASEPDGDHGADRLAVTEDRRVGAARPGRRPRRRGGRSAAAMTTGRARWAPSAIFSATPRPSGRPSGVDALGAVLGDGAGQRRGSAR